MSLVEELRSKQSRDNRELLDRAADRIEELEKAKYIYANVDYCAEDLVIELKKNERLQAEVERLQKAYDGLVADMKQNAIRDVCDICKYNLAHDECEDCCTCKRNCPCRECREGSNWKWRGEE